MTEIEYITEEDIRVMVEQECDFYIADQGLGYYEYGDGKYTDKNLQLSLTSQEIMIQYPIDTDSAILTRVTGTYYQDDEYGEYECDWIAELSHIEYYHRDHGCFEAHYDVTEG